MVHLLGPSSAPTHFAVIDFDSHFVFSSLTGSWSSVRTMISSLLSELMNAWWMGLSDLLKVTSLLCSLPQIIVVSHFFFPPNHIVFRLLSPGTFRKRSRQRRGRNWIKIGIFYIFWWGFFISAGTANNAGAILVLGRDLVVVPKLIHPIPPAIPSPESSPERHHEEMWMQVKTLASSI